MTSIQFAKKQLYLVTYLFLLCCYETTSCHCLARRHGNIYLTTVFFSGRYSEAPNTTRRWYVEDIERAFVSCYSLLCEQMMYQKNQ